MKRKELKIKLTRGLPASGKSTYSVDFIKRNNKDKWKRINRDSLRWMFDEYNYTDQNERFITEIETILVERALLAGNNVIWDNTFIKTAYLNNAINIAKKISSFGNRYSVTIDVIDFSDVPAEVCIERDSKRDFVIGAKVINRMAKDLANSDDFYPTLSKYNKYIQEKKKESLFYLPVDPSKQTGIIVDIDGTIADLNGRFAYDWPSVIKDKPINEIINLVNNYHELGKMVILLTGRSEEARQETIMWLEEYNVKWDLLYMKGSDDYRKSTISKKETFHEFIKPHFNIELAIDDSQTIIDMWRKEGLYTLNVNQDGLYR